MYVHHANITDLPLRFPQVRVLLPRDQHPERGEHPDPRRVRVRRVQPAGERIAQPRVGVAHVCERVEDDVPEADVSAAERGVLCRRRGGAGGDALRGGCVSTFFCWPCLRNIATQPIAFSYRVCLRGCSWEVGYADGECMKYDWIERHWLLR